MGPAFHPTNKKSNNIFQMALGNVAPGDEVVHLNLPLREAATEAHTVPGITNNLFSINKLANENYISVFDGDKLSIYDANSTRITVSRRAVLEGWHSEHEGIWRIPVGKQQEDIKNENIETVLVFDSPSKKLEESAAPPINHILSVYELKTQQELIRYYYAATGFPFHMA